MYAEETVIDQITILEDGQIQIRKAIRVLKDGVKISENYHRHVIAPDAQDISSEDDRVKTVANVLWTNEVIDKYKTEKIKREKI